MEFFIFSIIVDLLELNNSFCFVFFYRLKKRKRQNVFLSQQLKKVVKEFNDAYDSFSSDVESSDKLVSDHCELLKNRIDIRTESLIQEKLFKIEKVSLSYQSRKTF
jgi:hypothetical protein